MDFKMTISAGDIIHYIEIAGVFLALWKKMSVRIDQHDIMWGDFSRRKKIPWVPASGEEHIPFLQ